MNDFWRIPPAEFGESVRSYQPDDPGVQRLEGLACQTGMLRTLIYCWIVITFLSCGKTADKPASINEGLVFDSLHTLSSDLPDAFYTDLYFVDAMECPYGMYFLDSQTGFVTGKDLFSRADDGGRSWTSLKGVDFRMYEDVRFRNGQEGIMMFILSVTRSIYGMPRIV